MGLRHPIVIEERMNFDDMGDLVCKLRQGCVTTRNRIIEGFVPLALSLVRDYLEEFPNLRSESDDLASEAFLGIVLAIDTVMESDVPETDNIVAYVSVTITNRLHQNIHKDRLPVSRLGLSIDIPYETSYETETLDAILHECRTDRQRQVIKMRAEGRSMGEIGDRLGISGQTVMNVCRAVEERYNRTQRREEHAK